jgi:hypothetical protein
MKLIAGAARMNRKSAVFIATLSEDCPDRPHGASVAVKLVNP